MKNINLLCWVPYWFSHRELSSANKIELQQHYQQGFQNPGARYCFVLWSKFSLEINVGGKLQIMKWKLEGLGGIC